MSSVKNQKSIVSTNLAPAAIGTYSQAVKVGNSIYMSGQIPLDPATMELVKGDFKRQAQQVFSNLQQVATAANASLDDAVKLTVYLTDLANFATVNEVMSTYFKAPYPARVLLGVNALPKGALLEIDAILVGDF